MLRARLVGITLAVGVSLGSAVPTSSAALPELLPGTKNAFTTKGGKPAKFEQKGGIAAITCTASVGAGFVLSTKGGTFTEGYEKCTAPLSGNCTGLGDAVGDITIKGTWEVGYIDKATKDIGILYTLSPVHLECEKVITLAVIEGCVIALVTPINSDVKEYTIKLKGAKGNQEFIEDEAGECKLLGAMNGGAKAQSSLDAETKLTLANLVELMA